jgi:hypothetical protein
MEVGGVSGIGEGQTAGLVPITVQVNTPAVVPRTIWWKEHK